MKQTFLLFMTFDNWEIDRLVESVDNRLHSSACACILHELQHNTSHLWHSSTTSMSTFHLHLIYSFGFIESSLHRIQSYFCHAFNDNQTYTNEDGVASATV